MATARRMQPEDNKSEHYRGLKGIITYLFISQFQLLRSTQLVYDELEPLNDVLRNNQAT